MTDVVIIGAGGHGIVVADILLAAATAGQGLRPVFFYVSKKLRKAVYGGLSEEESESLEKLLQKVYEGFPKVE